MFRIKTDIRQFNCETQEKVEKLIRNWVIRPTDLLLDEGQQGWTPIGEHPDFAELFATLREGSEGELAGALSEPRQELGASPSSPALTSPGATQEASAPLPVPVAPEGVEEVSRHAEEVTMMTERTADLLGVEAGAEEAAALTSPLPVPVAPEGVEGVAPSDEPTQIYERLDDEESAPSETSSSEYELEEVSSPKASLGAEPSSPRLGRHDLPEELFLTNEISLPELVSPLEPMLDELREAGLSDAGEDSQAWEVTQQIESPLEAAAAEEIPLPSEGLEGVSLALSEAAEADIHSEWESMMELDELRDTGEFDAPKKEDEEDEEDVRATLELDSPLSVPEPRRVALASPPRPSDKIVIEDEYSRQSDEAQHEAPAAAPHASMALDDTEDFDAAAIFEASGATTPPPSLETEDTSSAEIDAQTLETESSPDDLDPEEETLEGDEREDDGPPAPLVIDTSNPSPVEEEEDEEPATPVHFQDRAFVSEGYTIPLPFVISPSVEDMRHGVRRALVDEEEKDRVFPRPQPKVPGELVSRRYGYGEGHRVRSPGSTVPQHPSRDYSPYVALAFLLLIVLIIASLIIFS